MLQLICEDKEIFKVTTPSLKSGTQDLNSSVSSDATVDDTLSWPVEATEYQSICEQCREWNPISNVSISEVREIGLMCPSVR